MEREYEQRYHALEDRHWWFSARRSLLRDLVRSLCPQKDAEILEIGCSSGMLIAELHGDGFSRVTGIDISPEAISESRKRGVQSVEVMDAQSLAFPDERFEVITASDVLEHLANEVGALRDWHRVLKPDGIVIIFVPAFQFLWSEHDEANQHQRRYRLGELKERVEAQGFLIQRESYWNFWLFFPIALIRVIKCALPARASNAEQKGDLFPLPRPINWLLYRLLRFENLLLNLGMTFPFGVSAMVIATKARPIR